MLVGTASWTDPTLLACGRFYPPGVVDAESRLRHYATRFPLVEVDATYYALPTRAMAAAWATRTPEHFTFDVKVCNVCKGAAQFSRVQAEADERAVKALGEKPPAISPRPMDGRRTLARMMSAAEVAARRPARAAK